MDLGPRRGKRKPADDQVVARNILQPTSCFAKEVMVIGGVGVEIRAAGLDDNFTQQSAIGELMQRVIDGRERYPDARRHSFAMQLLGGDMAVPSFEQETCQGNTLARGTQIYRTQVLKHSR